MDSSSDRLFNRQRTLHEILGGGFVADVMLWRRKDTTIGILLITLAAWVVFERSSYTLLSLLSSVLLLLITIFFLWSKSAAILNRYAWLYIVGSRRLCLHLTGLHRGSITSLQERWIQHYVGLCHSQMYSYPGVPVHALTTIPWFLRESSRPPPPLPDLYLSEEMVNEVAAIIRSRVNALFSVSLDIALGKDSNLFFKVAACLGMLSVVGGWTDFLTLGYTSLVIVLTLPALYEKYEDQIDRYVLIGYRELQRLYVELDTKCLSKIKNWVLEKRKLS